MQSGVHWFPGHMARARRQVQEMLALVDVVLEVVDARAPRASANPDLEAVVARRPRVVILNKADLADPEATHRWVAHLAAAGLPAVPMDALTGRGAQDVLAQVRRLFAPTLERLAARGRRPRPARAMVVGIPNVGKSAVLNCLAGRRRAAVGDRPGVTRGPQWVRVGQDIELLDTPGILMPKIADRDAGVLLAALGSVKEEVFDVEAVAGAVLPRLWALARAAVAQRLGLVSLDPDPQANLAAVARARGLVRAGGEPDTLRAAHLILDELRAGRFGRLTFEWPDPPPPSP